MADRTEGEQMATTLITGGTIVTAADIYKGDVLIDGEKVAQIGKNLKAPGAKRIVATGKYVDVLQPIFGDRLLFPQEFVGHGDMARGGILLQRAASGIELTYIPVSNPSRLGIRATKKARAEFDARLEANP